MTEERRPGTESEAATVSAGTKTNTNGSTEAGQLDVTALADRELEHYARRWSVVARQARRDLNAPSRELDDVTHAAALARLELKRRRAAVNLAAAHAEVRRVGGGR